MISLPKKISPRSGLKSVIPISRYQLRNTALTFAFRGGVFSRWSQIDWSRVDRLVFVCKGNICRSPYAEHRARSLGIDSISRGIEAGDGASVPHYAQTCGSFRGIDLSAHKSKKFDPEELRSGDLVLGMEPDHIGSLGLGPEEPRAQASLLGLWQEKPSVLIPDPFGGPITEFFTGILKH